MFLFRCCGITWNCIRIQGSLCIFCGMLRVSFVSCGSLSCLLFFSVYFGCLIVFLNQFSFCATEECLEKNFLDSSYGIHDWFLMILLFVLQVKIALFCLRVSVKFGVTILSLWHVLGGMLVVYLAVNCLNKFSSAAYLFQIIGHIWSGFFFIGRGRIKGMYFSDALNLHWQFIHYFFIIIFGVAYKEFCWHC